MVVMDRLGLVGKASGLRQWAEPVYLASRLVKCVGLMDRQGHWVGPADRDSGWSQQTDVAIATFPADATPDGAGLLKAAGIWRLHKQRLHCMLGKWLSGAGQGNLLWNKSDGPEGRPQGLGPITHHPAINLQRAASEKSLIGPASPVENWSMTDIISHTHTYTHVHTHTQSAVC